MTVIDFPTTRAREWMNDEEVTPGQPTLSCIDCQNVAMGTKGLFCVMFREPIVDDNVAQECPEFEPF